MKKILSMIIASVMLMTLFSACGEKKEPEETPATIANPNIAVESLSELNKKVGCNISYNEGPAKTIEVFTVINSEKPVAEHSFEIDGASYCVRSSKCQSDISGVWASALPLGDLAMPGDDIAPYKVTITNTVGCYYSRWYSGEYQYSVWATCTDEETFNALCDSLK